MAHPGGRPLKFETVEDLERQAEEYFKLTPPAIQTITGVALHLDTSRETLINYQKRDEFFDAVKKIKDRVENAYELSLRQRGSAGDIFGLKNFGWKDRQEVETTGEVTHKYEDMSDEELEAALKARQDRTA